MIAKGLSFLLGVVVSALVATSLFAQQGIIPTQVADQNRSGDLPFSTSVGTEIERVDIGSGDLIVHIPIMSLKGRGLDYNYFLHYSGHYWITNSFVYGYPGQNWDIEEGQSNPGLGWHDSGSDLTFAVVQYSCYPSSTTYYTSYIYTDPNGGKHPLAVQRNPKGSTCSANDQGPDLTGQGMWPTSRYLSAFRMADGRTYAPTTLGGGGTNTGQWTDANGNIMGDGVGTVDTLGRSLVTQQFGTNQVSYSVYDSNGVLRTYTVNTSTITLNTNFNVIGDFGTRVQEFSGSGVTVASSVVLPNNQSYQFQYENGSYGGLTQIALPTGGSVTYTWATLSDGARTYRYVASRTVNVGGQSYTWNFARSGTEHNITVDVTDPLGNHAVYAVDEGGVTSAKFYRGAATGNPLRQYVIDYDWDSDPWDSSERGGSYVVQQVGKRPIHITTTLDNGQVNRKEFDYDTVSYTFHPCLGDGIDTPCSQPGGNDFTTSRGNVTEIREYDYGSGTWGPLLRRTKKSYLHNANSTYLYYNIVDKVLRDLICSPQAACDLANPTDEAARTDYEYDNYTGAAAMIATSGAPQHDYTNYPPSFTYRGNATRVQRWRNTDGALLTTTYTYDDLGNIRAIHDPNNNPSSWSYSDSWANSSCLPPSGTNGQAYVTTFTNAANQNVKLSYYPCTGLEQAQQDQNDINAGRAGTTYTYDWLGRVLTKTLPDGGQTTNSYNDTPPVSVSTSTTITSGLNLTGLRVLDGLGREIQRQVTSDQDGTDFVDTTYDALGRKATVSNPYRSTSDPTYGITTYNYDALSRVTKLIPPDGSSSADNVTTTYAGNCTTVTDEAGKSRKSCSDALGRLTGVWEDPSGLSYETDYQYDALNNLTSVVQNGSRQRAFAYNSLSQLTSSTNPESNTAPSSGATVATTYSYDNDGNLSQKTTPAQNQQSTATVTLTYCYDALNRLTQKGYTAQTCTNGTMPSPVATYFYDQTSYDGLAITNGIGRRTGMSDAAGAEAWSYDVMGRPLTDRRTTNSVTKNTTYTYNLDGSVATLTYPSGRTITYTTGGAGRPLNAKDTPNSINYALSATYAPQGALASTVLGQTGSFTGINLNFGFDKRLLPTTMRGWSTNGTALDLAYSFNLGSSDNGNVMGITNNRDTTRRQSFTYDQLNRLATAQTGSTYSSSPAHCWGESFGYDQWGNFLSIGVVSSSYNGCTQESLSVTANAQNRIGTSGYVYDTAGNLTTTPNPGGVTAQYNAENQLTNANAVTYTYDGDGKRVQKSNGKLYWYGMGSDPLDETDSGGNPTSEYVFFGGKRIARLDWPNPNTSVYYYFEDHLGSSRVITNATGTVCYDADFYPFGGERIYTNTCPQNYKFTGKERDSESTLDYFNARHYSSALGRFMSPDPDNAGAVDQGPQTWNAYSYVRNNPLKYTDPNGTDVQICIEGSDKCYNLTDEQYKQLYQQQNGQQGINLPGGNLPTGDITCDGQKCGTATYFEKPLESDDFVNFAIGGLFKSAIEGGVGLLEGLFGSGARTAAGEAAAGAATNAGSGAAQGVVANGTKATVRELVEKSALSDAQKAAVKSALNRAGSTANITVEKLADGSVKVLTERAGRVGSQVIEKTIDAAGNTTSVVQKAYDAAGNLVHVDPKFP